MVDFTRAIKRPFTDLTKFIIGSALSIIPIVNFLAIGYELKCAKLAMNGDYKLPEWDEWGDLFVKGLLSVIIGIIYAIPVIIIVVLLIVAMVGTGMQGVASGINAGPGAGMGGGGLLAGMGISFVVILALGLVLAYILPSVMMTFVSNDFKFESAFRVGEIVKKTLNSDYLVTWIVVGVYTIVLSVILAFIPFIGTAIASFATGVTMMTAFGELYPKLKA